MQLWRLKWISVSLVLLAVCFSGGANAQVYGGFVAGISSPSNNGGIDDDRFPPIENATGYRVSLGNALSQIFAYEISYVDLGEYEIGVAEGEVISEQEESDSISLVGLDVAIVGNFHMTRNFAFYTKLGVFTWQAERTLVVLDPVTAAPTPVIQEFDETDVSAGLGFSFDFTRSIGFNVEASAYKTDDVYNYLYGAGFFVNF